MFAIGSARHLVTDLFKELYLWATDVVPCIFQKIVSMVRYYFNKALNIVTFGAIDDGKDEGAAVVCCLASLITAIQTNIGEQQHLKEKARIREIMERNKAAYAKDKNANKESIAPPPAAFWCTLGGPWCGKTSTMMSRFTDNDDVKNFWVLPI